MAPYGPQTVTEARDWLMDCAWADIDEEGIAALPAHVVMRAVARHYDGGVDAFMSDAA